MQDPEEHILTSYGDMDTASQVTPWITTYPYMNMGDALTKKYTATFMCRASAFVPLPSGAPCPIDGTALIKHQSDPTHYQGAFVTFTRTYSTEATTLGNTSSGIVTYESRIVEGLGLMVPLGTGMANQGGVNPAFLGFLMNGVGSFYLGNQVWDGYFGLKDFHCHAPANRSGKITSGNVDSFNFVSSVGSEQIFTSATGNLVFSFFERFAGDTKPYSCTVTKRYTNSPLSTLKLESKFRISTVANGYSPFLVNANFATAGSTPTASEVMSLCTSGAYIRVENDTVKDVGGGILEITTIEAKASEIFGYE